MNSDRILGEWKQVSGKLRERWGELIGDDDQASTGRREQIAGRIQRRYGAVSDGADLALAQWRRRRASLGFLSEGGSAP